jgi:FMN phosphatase YigB (HAD superfamily)
MDKIVLDVDGVILNFCKKYKEVAENFLERTLVVDTSKYNLHEFLQVTREDNHRVWNHFNQINAWQSIPALPGSEEAIEKINSLNLEVYIVSSVNPAFTDSRLKNLKALGLVPEKIFCVGDGNSHKHDYISKIKPLAFVDDRLDHLYRSLEVPHLAWVDNKQVQELDAFEGLSATVGSLNEWVDSHLISTLIAQSNNQSKRIKVR